MVMPYIPDDYQVDISNYEQPETSRSQGLGLSLQNTFESATTSQIGDRLLDAHSNKMSKEQWQNSEYFRDGLDLPNGTSLYRAQTAARRYDHQQAVQQELSGMPQGFLSGASKVVGSFIGFSLDPINLATMVLAPELVGEAMAPLAGALKNASSAAKIAGVAATGAIEGMAIVAPQTAAEYEANKYFGGNPEPSEAIMQLAFGAGLGALARTATGWKAALKPHEHKLALQTAIGQMAAGKSVDVELLMKNAKYQDFIHEMTADISDAEVKTNVTNELKNILKDRENLTEQRGTIDEQREPKLAKQIDDATQAIDEQVQKIAQKHGVEIPKAGEDVHTKTDDPVKDAKATLNGHKADDIRSREDPSPVNPEDLQNTSKKIASIDGDSAYNKNEHEAYIEDNKAIPETQSELLADEVNEVNGLKESNQLSEEEINTINDVKELDADHETMNTAYKALANCLIRNA